MNTAKVRPPRPDAPIYARAARRVPEIARRAVRQFVDEMPFYRLLPRDVLDGEATESAAAALNVFLRAVREGKAPSPEELTVSLNAAAHRAQEQVPLAAVLAAYHIAARVGWEALIEMAEPDELDEVLAAGPHVLRYLQEIVPAVAGVYLEERQAIHGEERETRRALVSALLSGQPAGALAARSQVPIAGAYAVLRLHLKIAEELTPAAGAAMTARRRVRQIQAVLDEFAGGPVLGTFDGHGGIALLPASPETVEEVLAGLPDVVTKVSGCVELEVFGGAAAAPDIASVPAAATQASEIADLAVGLARPPGVYLLDDLVLEYQITRQGPARDRLVARLESLAEHEHMLDALRAWVREDHDRRRAAHSLHIHPNTLDYRLHRVAEITGLDPLRPSDARLLAAALLVRSLE